MWWVLVLGLSVGGMVGMVVGYLLRSHVDEFACDEFAAWQKALRR